MNQMIARIDAHAQTIKDEAENSENLGRLSDRTVEVMREIGIIKMLQPATFGGLESHPADFLKSVFRLGSLSGSAGWVSGVVGLHPWEAGQMPEQVQRDIWGANDSTWIASPYAPIGRGTKVEGGYVFTGRWPFSSGTDHCDWAFLGGFDVDEPGRPLHFLIPREDYEIDQDSWNVSGLRGTGSKDVVVTEKFVPNERIVPFDEIAHGNASEEWLETAPLYRVPYGVLFPAAIASASIALAQGAVDSYAEGVELAAARSGKFRQTESQLVALGNAAADVRASFLHLIDGVNRAFDLVSAGRSVPIANRLEARRDQVRGVRRSYDAVLALYKQGGSAGLRVGNAFSRYVRDINVGALHATNYPELVMRGYSLHRFNQTIPAEIRTGPAPTRDSMEQPVTTSA